MTPQLIQHIQQVLVGADFQVTEIAHFFTEKAVTKGTILLTEGEDCKEIYFVNKGSLYLYYEQNSIQEVIHFVLENWWMTDYKTFSDGKPAVYAIAAMEDSELTVISRANYEAMLCAYPLMALYFNQIHERAYGAALFKQKTYALVSKPDFYFNFKRNYPAILQRIPDAIFASYMGISVVELENIKAISIS